ncbi:MAG: hypothetical protein ACD_71C00103G0005 [uncultured bacterium (gcode 4)]|uniref:Uncharacterized protein n=1 Tax=uncultured bacterium (gcode 4) TaxID=1234023 RepID=K1ZJF7_9BACT|nr:MAG: hypothetical protein ACD_71C00103G0005 [uncultured bacterium (gcode 4)]
MENTDIQQSGANKQTHTIDDHFKVERTTTKKPDGIAVFFDELFQDWVSVFKSHSMETEPTEILEDYKQAQEKFSQHEKNTLKYKALSPKEKYEHWLRHTVMIAFNGGRMSWSESIHVDSMRYLEPQIDKYLPFIIRSLAQSMINENIFESEEEVLQAHFILDEEAKKHVKIDTIEWISMDQPTLAEKLWDLFYDSLWLVLKELSVKIESESLWAKEIGEGELAESLSKAGNSLNMASDHIMRAWEICLPYMSADFLNLKHTHKIEEIGISNLELTDRIVKLRYDNLSSFLWLLSSKISKDWGADGARGRKKLSNELHLASEQITEAGKFLVK